MTIIWCMVPEIWSTTDIIFCHSGPFFALLPPMDQENQNCEEMKQTAEDIIILQTCTINDSHMIYGSWDMQCNGQNFLSFGTVFRPRPSRPNNPKNFSFWTFFCNFTPLTTRKIKILKNWKKRLEILSFYTCVL